MNAKSDTPRCKRTAERPPKDRRGVPSDRPTRGIRLLVENQEVTSINGPLGQYVDFQAVRYCGKEGTKKRECDMLIKVVTLMSYDWITLTG